MSEGFKFFWFCGLRVFFCVCVLAMFKRGCFVLMIFPRALKEILGVFLFLRCFLLEKLCQKALYIRVVLVSS